MQDWWPLSHRLCDHPYTLLHSALSMLPQCTCRLCEPRDGSTAQVGRGPEESPAAVKVLGLAKALQDPELVRSPPAAGHGYRDSVLASSLPCPPGSRSPWPSPPHHARPHHTIPTPQSQPGSALMTPLPTRGWTRKHRSASGSPSRHPFGFFRELLQVCK